MVLLSESRDTTQFNLEFVSVIQNLSETHLSALRKGLIYIHTSYPVKNCNKLWTPFFTFSRIPFHLRLCNVSNTYQICIL